MSDDMPALPPGVREELERTAGRALDARWFLGKAIEALAAGDAGAALENATRAKDAASRAPTVRETLGVAHYLAKDFKAALAELQAFRRLSGSRAQDVRIADCYRGTGRPLRAVEYLDEVDARGPAAVLVRAGGLDDAGDQAGAAAVLMLGNMRGQAVRPPGFLPPGSVGSSADTRRRKSGRH